jgi:hypothetical protein
VIRDRGVLRNLEVMEFGMGGESDEEIRGEDEREATLGPEMVQFESDEDELGEWGERSGLDPQEDEESEEEVREDPVERRRDDELLAEFMRAEGIRRAEYDKELEEKRANGGVVRSLYESELEPEEEVSEGEEGSVGFYGHGGVSGNGWDEDGQMEGRGSNSDDELVDGDSDFEEANRPSSPGAGSPAVSY